MSVRARLILSLDKAIKEVAMYQDDKNLERFELVKQIMEELDSASADLLADWDGAEIDDLAQFLSEEDFQTLLDRLDEADEFQAP